MFRDRQRSKRCKFEMAAMNWYDRLRTARGYDCAAGVIFNGELPEVVGMIAGKLIYFETRLKTRVDNFT